MENNEEHECSDKPEQSAILHALCTLCAVLCPSKRVLLVHMKDEHGILQPYQCFACLKRYATGGTLYKHRQKYCKRKHYSQERVVNTFATYTLPSFIYDCNIHWTPMYGDILVCQKAADGGVIVISCKKEEGIMYINLVVGRVPQSLTRAFLQFLENGTIHVRLAGAIINLESGLQIPADYIFTGDNQCLNKLIEEIERNKVKKQKLEEEYGQSSSM